MTKVNITFHDLILGGQDGLVNVLGLSLGLFAAHSGGHLIIVAGLAAGFSEAISMGAVAYTSSLAERRTPEERSGLLGSSVVVGVSALIGSILPILPFLFITELNATITGIILSAIILFAAGYYRATITHESRSRSGLQMVIIGIACAFAGFLIGMALQTPA